MTFERIPFSQTEVDNMVMIENPWGPPMPAFETPVTAKENMKAAFERKPYWIPTGGDIQFFHPTCQPCYIARGTSDEGNPITPDQYGGLDMFGVKWVFDYEAWGSMEDPNEEPLFEDANDWKDVLVWPNVDSWDWEGSAAKNKDYLDTPQWVCTYLFSGYFERLISFMGFENAAVAMIDEDQEDAVKELFEKLTDLYIDIVDHMHEAYGDGIDEFMIHDDWGSKAAPFFSKAAVDELIVPNMKRLVDHVHELGYYMGHHCCGEITPLFESHHACGFDKLEAQDLIDRDLFYERYGDKEMLTISADPIAQDASDEEVKHAVESFVERFFNAGKRGMLETFYVPLSTEYLTELYIATRKKSEEF